MDLNKKNIHILFFGADYFGEMASTQRIKNLINSLKLHSNIQISNLVINSTTSPENVSPQIVPYFNAKYVYYNPLSVIRYIIKTFKFLKSSKAENSRNIFYCYGYPDIENIWTLLFAKYLKYKIVFDIVENETFSDLEKSSLRHRFKIFTLLRMQKLIPILGSACFAISSHLVSYIEKICKNAIPTVYLPICVDIEYIQKFKKSKRNDGLIKLFYGGSFGYKDGIPEMLKAFEFACERNSNLELVMTGKLSKEIIPDFFNLVNKSPVNKKINYLGCIPIDDYYKTLVDCDILCMVRNNSAYANAGFPFKLGEYLASGNAIIATKVSDISSYLSNNIDSILIDPEDVDQLCDAILLLAKDENLRIKICVNTLDVAKKNFDSKIVSDILLKTIYSI